MHPNKKRFESGKRHLPLTEQSCESYMHKWLHQVHFSLKILFADILNFHRCNTQYRRHKRTRSSTLKMWQFGNIAQYWKQRLSNTILPCGVSHVSSRNTNSHSNWHSAKRCGRKRQASTLAFNNTPHFIWDIKTNSGQLFGVDASGSRLNSKPRLEIFELQWSIPQVVGDDLNQEPERQDDALIGSFTKVELVGLQHCTNLPSQGEFRVLQKMLTEIGETLYGTSQEVKFSSLTSCELRKLPQLA
ncbi:thiazole synthase [Striga asiatica]|uniref:Thiazole synthase n=1 Tax=Striga asiatica TaxID=4170 RepID=A0A5A7PZK5_STRAF|nr:thiazole synthase [Striga asiatica]